MLRVFETFAGIGAQRKALELLKKEHFLDYKIVATSEWDIGANLSYNSIHFNNQSYYDSCIPIDDIKAYLSQFTHSLDSKKPISLEKFNKLDDNTLRHLYSSYKNANNLGSITEIEFDSLVSLDINLITYSFPCQDLSSAGKNGGMKNGDKTRSGLLWEIDRLLQGLQIEGKLPSFLLLENVPNMIKAKHKGDYSDWIEHLHNQYGYKTQTYCLDAQDYGSPQKRKRVYALSVLDNNSIIDIWEHNTNLPTNLPRLFTDNNNSFWNISKKSNLSDVLRLDYSIKKYFNEAMEARPRWTLSREKMLLKNPLLCHYYSTNNVDDDSLIKRSTTLSITTQAKIQEKCRTVTTKQDRNPNCGVISLIGTPLEVPKLEINMSSSNYRFLTPRETFMLMGFDEEDYQKVIIHPINNKEKLYRQAGNSIVVPVLKYLFLNINYLNQRIQNDD
ncbi:DNA (cytosine-5)-methyltransferase 1 [Entomoplasma freundtii]|uniref:Cytosine-specific methyltransferase n=1 Tax=Entomoplasma freundtii TaxID=74700 RepID=A0A2K8NR27_9MOLU|nr:DNA (cytosine-5-)-methyltransferase [Entomoplasma freundtii]ATZ16305.1 DNA-methyltransferase [Entomoplasma freundtii]TDY56793.1 DNA (cytosine-5)-methyltransferase 1 [Entomoplasma freundtii]